MRTKPARIHAKTKPTPAIGGLVALGGPPGHFCGFHMNELSSINYLHYGNAIDFLADCDLESNGEWVKKSDFLASITNGNYPSQYVRAIVDWYGGRRAQWINLTDLQADLEDTALKRHHYSKLGCRGFSYTLYGNMDGFPYRLRSRINLRMALAADRGLFYPGTVRDFIGRTRRNHYFAYDSPAIAFALGIRTKAAWYILTLQSDLVRYGPAAVREHFRGWRKVLFDEIVSLASKDTKRVFLSREEDVLCGCHKDHRVPGAIPQSWKVIYGRTARDFGMRRVRLIRRVNVQLYDRRRPMYADTMYCLEL